MPCTPARSKGAGASKLLRAFPVHTPLPQLMAELNDYRPAFMIGYARTIMLLTAEQEPAASASTRC
ncbi:hypothetical protein [Streptomyces sp. NPDC017993]|uniref:hypothetical protein n=1 Tax=Streptomyces sp. NPDC017993 TaxID=3365027 RepID=UPI003792694A